VSVNHFFIDIVKAGILKQMKIGKPNYPLRAKSEFYGKAYFSTFGIEHEGARKWFNHLKLQRKISKSPVF
jgi:hypothetical protein